MKKLILFLSITILAGLLLASCNTDDTSPDVGNTPVAFAPNISGAQATARASGTTWATGDAIGVFMTTALQPVAAGNLSDNVKYSYDGAGFTTSTPIYYPMSGAVDFVAYYPYRTTPNPDPYVYKVDVATQTTPAAIDLLYASKSNVVKSTAAVPLTFNHKLSQIVLTVKKDISMGTTNLSTMRITIAGMPTKADFNLADGTFSNEGTTAAISPRTIEAGVKYAAIVIPQTGNSYAGRKMIFAVGADRYEYTIQNSDYLESGKSYGYTVTVKKTGVSVSRGDIAEWTNIDISEDIGSIEQLPIAMVLIPAGTFQMGSPGSDADANGNEKPQHWVKLTKDFYMSKYQITNAQYALFLDAKGTGSNGIGSVTYNNDGISVTGYETFISDNNGGVQWDNVNNKWIPAPGYENHPVIYVSWYGASEYARWIGGSLPTEAQWEYACRAGTTTIYSYADAADGDYMWYWDNNTFNGEASGTKAVGRILPNTWGLYDMHGNVSEWCLDQWDGGNNYPTAATEAEAVENPLVTEGSNRVFRSGGWHNYAQNCRSAYRNYGSPNGKDYGLGFRVVFVP